MTCCGTVRGIFCHRTCHIIIWETHRKGLRVLCRLKLVASSGSSPLLGWSLCRQFHRAPTLPSNLESSKQVGRIKVSKCQGLCPFLPWRLGCIASALFPRRGKAHIHSCPGRSLMRHTCQSW